MSQQHGCPATQWPNPSDWLACWYSTPPHWAFAQHVAWAWTVKSFSRHPVHFV
jgi:hypothetical protein